MDEAAQAAERLRQGSIIGFNLTSWMANPAAPLHPFTVETVEEMVADGDAAINVNAELGDYSMVVSQSCDLARTRTDRYWATLCPVVPLPTEGSDVAGIRQGNNRRYVPLPWHPDSGQQEWFADLHLVHTIERSLLIGVNELARPDEQQRRTLAERLGQYLSRPALPPEVDLFLAPLKKIAKSKHGKATSPDGIALNEVVEIRVDSTPDFDAPPPWKLDLYFVVKQSALRDDPDASGMRLPLRRKETPAQRLARAITSGRSASDPPWDQMWVETVNAWTSALKTNDTIRTAPTIHIVTALTPDEYRTTDLVDLAHLSESDN